MEEASKRQLVCACRALATDLARDLGDLAELLNADPAGDPAAVIAARRRKALGEVYSGAMAPFREAIIQSTSPEDALRRLQDQYKTWSPSRLMAEIEAALQVCAAMGAGDAVS